MGSKIAKVSALTLLILGVPAARAWGREAVPDTIQKTMDRLIDPAADALWGAVGTVETQHGTVRRAPKSLTEWQRAETYARDLVAGARKLTREGFPVGNNSGGFLADADTLGSRTATQIRTDIDRDPVRFQNAAIRLQMAGSQALAAIQERNADKLFIAGETIDAACEACHSAYWYPRTPPLRLPTDQEFDRHRLPS